MWEAERYRYFSSGVLNLFFITLYHSLVLVFWTAWSVSPSLLDLNVAGENFVGEPWLCFCSCMQQQKQWGAVGCPIYLVLPEGLLSN